MKIKKIINYLFGFLVVLLFAIGFSDAEVIGISQSEWNSKPDSYWFSQSCDEVVWNEVYSGEYQIYLDNFENPSSNHGALYIWNYKVLTRGNYILYNNSNGGSAGNGLVIFNRDYLESINWKVNPGQTVRHLTTAEEVNGATFQWNWSFNTPYHAGLDGMLFHTPNFRSDGSHPNTPTPMQGNGYGDAEIRAITLYDSDNNLNTSSNNRAIVECWRNVIRRCGDGIVDTNHGETCDEGTLNGTPGHCNTSCNGTTIQNPQCSSTYNNQIQYTPDGSNWLSQNMNLCTIGSVTNFQILWNPGNSRHFTWNCTAGGNSTDCLAYQQWCGDGKVESNYGETCDEGTLNGTPGHCNTSCTGIVPQQPQCNSQYDGQTQYTDNSSTNWLNANMNLCTVGTVKPNSFDVNWTFGDVNGRHFTWQCQNGGSTVSCDAYQKWCGDGVINSGSEMCEKRSQNRRGGCNNNCTLRQPECIYNLTATPDGQPAPQNVEINKEYIDPNNTGQEGWARLVYLRYGDGQSAGNGRNAVLFPKTHTYNAAGTYTITGEIRNTSVKIRTGVSLITGYCTTTVTLTEPVPTPYCGDAILQPGEQCDPGSENFGNGCNSGCQLMVPTCTLTVNPDEGEKPLTTTINGTKSNWATYKSLSYGDNTATTTNPTFPRTHTYNQIGTFDLTLTVQNNYNGQITGVSSLPTNTCTASVTTFYKHWTIEKELLTAGDLTAGSTVAYKVTLTNDGNTTIYDAYIDDVRPKALNYLTSSIVGVSDYDFTTFADDHGAFHIKYYNFNLAAGQAAVVYLTGTLKQGFNFKETTNCAMTSGAVDCEEFPLSPVPYIQKYQKIGNDLNPNSNGWTTDVLTVGLGDFISYRIDFANLGRTGARGEVRDLLPDCVNLVEAHLVGASGNGPFTGQHKVRFTNIWLEPGQTGHMMVLGQIKQQDGCQNVYSYLNTGEFHFINKPWQPSTVLAERPNTTDVEITKEVSPTGTVQQGDVVTYTINYRNKGPEVLQTYTIVDYWPTDKLDFSGVVYTNPNPSSYTQVGDNIIKRVFNTPLGVGQTGQIVIQGVVK